MLSAAVGLTLGLGVGLVVGRLLGTDLRAFRVLVVIGFVAPVAGTAQVSPFLAAMSGICVARLLHSPRRWPRGAVVVLLALQVVVDVAALAYSPQPLFALRALSAGLVLVLVAALVTSDVRLLARLPDDSTRLVQVLLALQAASVVLFRLVPAVETRYLSSELGTLIIGARARDLFTDQPDNVVQDDKAGGLLFTNGNIASMVMAFFALFLLAQYIRRPRPGAAVVALLCAAASVLTGSKTAAILALTLLPLMLLVYAASQVRRSTLPLGVALVALPVAVGAGIAVYQNAGGLAENSAAASGVRTALWDAARDYLAESPVLGVGFGGWQQLNQRSTNGIDPDLPPHNFLLYDWLQAGIVAPLLTLALLGCFGWAALRLLAVAESPRTAFARVCEVTGVVWVVAHGLYDVTDFYGATNTMTVVVMVLCSTVGEGVRRHHDADHPDPGVLPGPRGARGRGLGSRV